MLSSFFQTQRNLVHLHRSQTIRHFARQTKWSQPTQKAYPQKATQTGEKKPIIIDINQPPSTVEAQTQELIRRKNLAERNVAPEFKREYIKTPRAQHDHVKEYTKRRQAEKHRITPADRDRNHRGRVVHETKPQVFTQEEVSEMFNSTMLKSIFKDSQRNQKQEEDRAASKYRNTVVKPQRFKKETDLNEAHLDQKLREKIGKEKDSYDFKVIKRKFASQDSDRVYLNQMEIALKYRMPQVQKSAEKLLNIYQMHHFSFGAENTYELFRRVARAIPLDTTYGGDYACTARFRLRSRDDPRFTDRRMQALLAGVKSTLPKLSATQLSHVFYSCVKLRLPEDDLINGLLDNLTIKLKSKDKKDDLTIKDLALVTWACARIKIPKQSEIPKMINLRARNIVNETIYNRFFFDWKAPENNDIVNKNLETDLQNAHGCTAMHEKYEGQQEFSQITHISNNEYQEQQTLDKLAAVEGESEEAPEEEAISETIAVAQEENENANFSPDHFADTQKDDQNVGSEQEESGVGIVSNDIEIDMDTEQLFDTTFDDGTNETTSMTEISEEPIGLEEKPVAAANQFTLNTQAFGMIYWGLSKMLHSPRQKFHKQSEILLQKSVEQMLADPESFTPEDPVQVFDQLVQTCGVMCYTQVYINNDTISNITLEMCKQTLQTRSALAQKPSIHHELPFNQEREVWTDYKQLIHLKLITNALARDRKIMQGNKDQHVGIQRRADHAKDIAGLCYSIMRGIKAPLPLSHKSLAGIVGNLCQILRSTAILDNFNDMSDYRSLIILIKQITGANYNNHIKIRDFTDIVQGICFIYAKNQKEQLIWTRKRKHFDLYREVQAVAQRSAIMMHKMSPLSRQMVHNAFRKIQFQEPNLQQAFKKHGFEPGDFYVKRKGK